MNNALRKSILKTLAYFDLENYPLTREELFNYLWEPPFCSYAEFLTLFDSVVKDGDGIQEKWGYFFLKGREEIVEKRRSKIVPTESMLKKARRAVKLIRSVPFLKAVFICNSVGRETAEDSSDIDFLIISHPKRIWLVRFFTNAILRLFRLRTYGNHEEGRVCLSFFLDTEHLDLGSYRVCEDDIHFAYWIHQMLPMYDPEGLYTKFVQANFWTQKFLPNLNTNIAILKQGIICHFERNESRPSGMNEVEESLKAIKISFPLKCTNAVENSKIGMFWKKVWEKMWLGNYGDLLETEAKKFQFAKLKLSLKEKAKTNDNGVVLDEGILKFHEHDTRRAYRDGWIEKCRSMQNL